MEGDDAGSRIEGEAVVLFDDECAFYGVQLASPTLGTWTEKFARTNPILIISYPVGVCIFATSCTRFVGIETGLTGVVDEAALLKLHSFSIDF